MTRRQPWGLLTLGAMVVAIGGCVTTEQLLARRQWREARERARWHDGSDAALVDRWMRGQVTLRATGDAKRAEPANVDPETDTRHLTFPLEVTLTVDVDPGLLRAVGYYRIAVRHDGVLWMPGHSDVKAWQHARSIWALFGDRDRPWPPVPPGTENVPHDGNLFQSYEPHALVCSNFSERGKGQPPFGPDRCQDTFLLLPLRSSPGPDMLIVSAMIQWPDADTDALTWRRLAFATALPPADSLSRRINAALGKAPRVLPAVGPEIHDYE